MRRRPRSQNLAQKPSSSSNCGWRWRMNMRLKLRLRVKLSLRQWRQKPTRSLAPYHRLLLLHILFFFFGVFRLQGATTFAQPGLVIILLGCDSTRQTFHPLGRTTTHSGSHSGSTATAWPTCRIHNALYILSPLSRLKDITSSLKWNQCCCLHAFCCLGCSFRVCPSVPFI